MYILSNNKFSMMLSNRGIVHSLQMKEDKSRMNWVIDPGYLEEAGYTETDKLFGEWMAVVNGKPLSSVSLIPSVEQKGQSLEVKYKAGPLDVTLVYTLNADNEICWRIQCSNLTDTVIHLNGFHVWFSLAYIMYRDQNVIRNMRESCALYPNLGGDFAKFAAIRRSNEAPHLGIYNIQGKTATLGTYCTYENRFLEQVSPSLDGLLYHRLSLVEDGSSMPDSAAHDWIYRDAYASAELQAGETRTWEYVFVDCSDQDDFYRKSLHYDHPRWSFTPVLTVGGRFEGELTLSHGTSMSSVKIVRDTPAGEIVVENITSSMQEDVDRLGKYKFSIPQSAPGERKLELTLEDGRKDVLIWNVLEPIDRILEQRADWLCRNSYDEFGEAGRPHAFLPLSNQGESLGKLTFVLMKNSLSTPNSEQVQKVEMAAVIDIRNHWFEEGNFSRPRALYGSFYRVYDFDYIGHVFYLLSRMDASLLQLNTPQTYLNWAAELMCVRLNPDAHRGQREKDEARLNGVFILYIQELLQDLQTSGLSEQYEQLKSLWDAFSNQIVEETRGYQGAITEHFYDNAGFGPTCEALCRIGLKEEAEQYGELILANIGFSNDYRAQNPDRWWEALSYMVHSLWGGLVAGSARSAYEHLHNPEYLEAAYRATMAVFHCYDWHVRSTPRRLEPGEAASTYSVAAPNLNMPKLSRNRFGQSIFRDAADPLFRQLFANATGDDWDMGEELAAYLLGFGTTTYLYRDATGDLRCVNGYAVQEEEGWLITSYAAYPQKFVLYEDGLVFQAESGQRAQQVRLQGGRFLHVR